MTIALAQALGAAIARDWHGDFDAVQRAALADIVRTAFIDTAACVLAAREEPATRAVAAWARQRGGTPRAAILFGAERLPAAVAALVNGVAGHALDYDDVGLAGHPSGVLVPALWAECEAGGPTGFALVQAYAKGYAVWGELQRRLRVPLHARGWHPSAVFGVVAAAAAVAALRGLDAGQAAHALGVAASQAGGVVANFGSMTKPLHVGRAAEGGIAAVDLVLQGHDHTYGRRGEGQAATPQYVVTVAGPKQYRLSDEARRTMDPVAEDTQLFQVLRIDPQRLRYEARTVTGRLYDSFELRRDAQGSKQRTELTEGRIAPRDCPRARTAKGRADRCWE